MDHGSVSPNDFAGTDTERINLAIAQAANEGIPAVIPRLNPRGPNRDEWLIDAAILLPSHVTVELHDCRIKLSDRCRDNFFRSANCGQGITDIRPLENIHIRGVGRPVLQGADHPRATGDSGKTLGERTVGSDAGVEGESQTGDWRNIGILLANVTRFSIENVTIQDAHCWAISMEYCGHGRLRNLDFDARGVKVINGQTHKILNQDGIDLRRGCHDILIENITGNTGDDLIALTAIPGGNRLAGSLGSTMISGAEPREGIWNVIIRNVKGHGCPHHIIRLLNNSGLTIHDIIIDGLVDTSVPPTRCRAAVKIGDINPRYGGPAPLGDTSRVIVNNIISRAADAVFIQGSLTDSIISNVIKYDPPGEAVACPDPATLLRDVRITNVQCAGV